MLAVIISLPLGYIAVRYKKLYYPLVNISSILYAIPSLALFALFIPLVGIGNPPKTKGTSVRPSSRAVRVERSAGSKPATDSAASRAVADRAATGPLSSRSDRAKPAAAAN